MFGYILPNQKELKGKEIDEYRSWYCGLCHRLKKDYGFSGQLSLNYDMTFLAILLTGLYEPEVIRGSRRCLAHPSRRHPTCDSEFVAYAADMTVLLNYYKCRDDWEDERRISKAGYGALLFRGAGKAARKYPQKAGFIKESLKQLSAQEQASSTDIDRVSGIFGDICREIFVYREDEWKEQLSTVGFYLGKFIYLMDAWEDLEKDQKKGCYNPLKEISIEPNYEERVFQILTMMMAECCRAFERLPILENIGILRNILYSGVWSRYYILKKKREDK